MAMFKKEGEFRFEDYKKADDAKEALLTMHPVGSSVDDVVKTLKGVGAKCRLVDGKTNKTTNILNKEDDFAICSKMQRKYLIFTKEWRVIIYPSPENYQQVKSLKVLTFLQYI